MNFGFAAFNSLAVLDQQGGVIEVPVYSGEAENVRLKAASTAQVVVPTGREQDLEIQYQLSPYYQAPIGLGQAMGIASVRLDQQLIAEIPLVSMSAIDSGGWWKRMIDSIELRLRQLSSK